MEKMLQGLGLSWFLFSFVTFVHWSVCLFSHVQLFITPMDCSLPGSSVDGIFQVRILEWDVCSSQYLVRVCS